MDLGMRNHIALLTKKRHMYFKVDMFYQNCREGIAVRWCACTIYRLVCQMHKRLKLGHPIYRSTPWGRNEREVCKLPQSQHHVWIRLWMVEFTGSPFYDVTVNRTLCHLLAKLTRALCDCYPMTGTVTFNAVGEFGKQLLKHYGLDVFLDCMMALLMLSYGWNSLATSTKRSLDTSDLCISQ